MTSPETFVERAGLESEQRRIAVRAVLDEVHERGLHTMRLSCVDQHGLLRTKTVDASRLGELLATGIGIPASVLATDTANSYAVPLWSTSAVTTLSGLIGAQDVIMLPDPSTFRVPNWVAHTGWLLCDLYRAEGAAVTLSTRALCAAAESALRTAGYQFMAGLEMEFHLYDLGTGQPIHPGWDLLSDTHSDAVIDRLQPIRDGLGALGCAPRTIEVELGPGQIELTFAPGIGLAVADDAVIVRSAIRQLARRAGLQASFMCRPGHVEAFPSGWHLHQSLLDTAGHNVFAATSEAPSRAKAPLSDLGRHWVGGLLRHAAASCLLTTPTVNGYKRYRPNSVAPDRVAWARQHRGAMLRVIGSDGDASTRVENRVGDPAANPYLYLASQMICGLDGLTGAVEPPPITDSPYHPDVGPRLPRSLGEAIDGFAGSELYRTAWGAEVVEYLLMLKRSEWARFLAAVTDWEQREYFNRF